MTEENSKNHLKPRKLSYDEIFSRRPTLGELKKLERFPIYAVIENIRSVHNVGSIFRSSDGARISKLYLCGYTAYPPRQDIEKTALGSTDSVPWEYVKDPLAVIKELKSQGAAIVALEHTTASINYCKADYHFPICLVVGNEVDGVSRSIIAHVDYAIDLPMFGLKQSLNVSVAYGVALYRILDAFVG